MAFDGGWDGYEEGVGGGSPDPVVVGAVATADSIRDRMITVIGELSPTMLPGTKFRAYRNEGNGVFVDWASANPGGAFRRFSVRDIGDDGAPGTSTMTEEWRQVIFQVVVAYTQSHRAGPQNALDRDDAMSADQHLIENAIGWRGGANFANSYPNATYLKDGYSVQRLIADPVDFLVITQTMGFYRSV